MVALSPDGDKLWEFQTAKPIYSSPSLPSSSPVVLFGSHDGYFLLSPLPLPSPLDTLPSPLETLPSPLETLPLETLPSKLSPLLPLSSSLSADPDSSHVPPMIHLSNLLF